MLTRSLTAQVMATTVRCGQTEGHVTDVAVSAVTWCYIEQ